MKIILSAIIILTCCLAKCKDENGTNTNPVTSIKLSILQFPMKHHYSYRLDSGSIVVSLVRDSANRDSVISEKKIDTKNFTELCKLILDFDKDRYKNKCIEDGQLFNLVFNAGDSVLKDISFSNYYHPGMGKIIGFINSTIDSAFTIGYDKESLLKLEAECK